MASKAFLQQAYLAYFGRPADVSGLAYYADQSEAQVKAAFSASPESQAFFGSMAVAAQINTIYKNLFNRDAEPAGLTYWSQEIGSGRLSLADAAMASWLVHKTTTKSPSPTNSPPAMHSLLL